MLNLNVKNVQKNNNNQNHPFMPKQMSFNHAFFSKHTFNLISFLLTYIRLGTKLKFVN